MINIKFISAVVFISSAMLFSHTLAMGDVATTSIDSKIMAPSMPQINIDSVYGNNTVVEDYDYNANHFYTKKLKLKVSVKDEDLRNIKKIYLVLSNQNYWPIIYAKEMDTTSWNTTPVINKEDVNKYIIRYDFKDNIIPEELIIDIKTIQDKLLNTYWESFNPQVYAETFDWKEILLTNWWYSYVYLPKDNANDKQSFISNLWYTKWLQVPYYYDTYTEKLNSILQKIKDKNPTKYISILEEINTKILTVVQSSTDKKNKVISSIVSDEDFAKYVDDYFKVLAYDSVITFIQEKVKLELDTWRIDSITDTIFWKYIKD